MTHFTVPPDYKPFKTREEQDEDFKLLATMADKQCPTCFGTAKNGWNTETQLYVPCSCVLKNLEKEMAKQNIAEDKRTGILQRIREQFGMN